MSLIQKVAKHNTFMLTRAGLVNNQTTMSYVQFQFNSIQIPIYFNTSLKNLNNNMYMYYGVKQKYQTLKINL